MTNLISDFPNEIIIIIGENLEIRDLSSLILTSRRYNTLLRPLLRPRLLKLAPLKEYAFTALFWSVLTGDDEQAKIVLDESKGIDIIDSPGTIAARVYWAVRTFDIIVWDWVRKSGAKLVIRDNGGYRDSMGFHGYTPIQWAIKSRHQGLLKLALEKYEEKGIDSLTGEVDISIKEGNLEAASILLSEIKRKLGEDAWKKAHTRVVEMSIWYKQESAIKLLFADGADVNEPDNLKRTALHLAVARQFPGPVKLLLDMGADTNSQGWFGQSPLHVACKLREKSIIELLLQHGADVDLEDLFGNKPKI